MKKHLFSVAISLLLICICLSGCTDSSNDQTNGQDDYQNPTKDKKESSQYQWSQMSEGPYHDKISYATSANLLDWTDSQQHLVMHASVPGAIYKDGVIYVYFVDVSENGIPEQIGLIRSEDNGATWSSKETVQFQGISEKVPVDPAPFLLDDGRIRLYYYDINEGRLTQNPSGMNKIYSAISTDGLLFTHEEGVRFQREDIFDPDVVYVDGLWRLYVGEIMGNQIICAVSTDGLSFSEEGVAYIGGTVPDVFYKDGIYYLYTVGIDISTSQNGDVFTKTSSSFHSQLGLLTADASVIELDNGTYMMLYKTK